MKKLTAIDPSSGKVLHEVSCDTASQASQKIETSLDAYHAWRKLSFGDRASVLRNVASYMRENRDALGKPMTEEMGKPVREAVAEVDKAAWCAEHYADNAEAYLADSVIASDATKSFVQYLPIGPVLGILPWNAPFWLAFRFCAPALMAGNTCLMKHDPHVPACAQAIAEVFEKAGAPAGIMQALLLANDDVEGVIRDDRVRAVSFTGSSVAGAKVAAAAASEIKPAVLELGGSDPCIVLRDADLKEAAKIICLSRIINAGQSCIAAKRILVEAPVYDQMVDLLKEQFAALRLGDPRDQSTDVGPIARENLRDELHRQVKNTIDSGARCLLGGEIPDGDGFYYPVTLLVDVEPGQTAFCEETFGPVGVVTKVENADHALELANDTRYGLAASIWGGREQAETMAREIEAGQVAINGIVKTDPRLPSGGIKRSGYGRELGPHGIHEFVNAQQVWIGPKKD